VAPLLTFDAIAQLVEKNIPGTGAVAWSPWSPSLNLLDVFLWEFMFRYYQQLWEIVKVEYDMLGNLVVICYKMLGREQNAVICAETQTGHILNSTKVQYRSRARAHTHLLCCYHTNEQTRACSTQKRKGKKCIHNLYDEFSESNLRLAVNKTRNVKKYYIQKYVYT
jgi:hypothetical protein